MFGKEAMVTSKKYEVLAKYLKSEVIFCRETTFAERSREELTLRCCWKSGARGPQ
jgi:hypothetical protein